MKSGVEADEEFDTLEAAEPEVFFEMGVGAFAAESFFAGGAFEFVKKLRDDGHNFSFEGLRIEIGDR